MEMPATLSQPSDLRSRHAHVSATDPASQADQLPTDVAAEIDSYFSKPVKGRMGNHVFDIGETSVRKSEAHCLAELVRRFRPQRSLELGLALAGSAVAILAARKSAGLREKHLILDPFQDEVERIGLRVLAEHKLDQYEWLPERSEDYLPNIDQRFDFIFMDAAKEIGHVCNNAFYGDRLLNPGGVIAFHDALIFSTSVAVRYLICERGYEFVTLPGQGWTRRAIRTVRYLPKLGIWYVTKALPHMHGGLVAVRKRLAAN